MGIKTSGFNPIIKKLGKLAAANRSMAAPARATGEAMHTRVMVYAPQGSHVRTFTLRVSMTREIKHSSRGVKITVGSRGAVQKGRRYDLFVKDSAKQAAMHSGRWATYKQDLSFMRGTILSIWANWLRGLTL